MPNLQAENFKASPGLSALKPMVAYVPKQWRTPMRWTIRKMHAISHSRHGRVFLTTLPKAGTHLLAELLRQLGFRIYENQPFNPNVVLDYDPQPLPHILNKMMNGEFVIEHLAWNNVVEEMLAGMGFKVLFIYRDPRATAVSFAHYVGQMNRNHRLHEFYRSFSGLDERVLCTLDGVSNDKSSNGFGRAPLSEVYDRFMPWLKSPAVCAVKYEDLIGARGGESDDRQLSTVKRTLEFLNLDDEYDPKKIGTTIFNEHSPTFRKAHSQSWRDEIKAETLIALNRNLSRQMSEWGYSI